MIEDWRKERMKVGQLRYGDRDLKRYNLVDIVEELLDALNIMERMINRSNVYKNNGYGNTLKFGSAYEDFKEKISNALSLVNDIDKLLPDDFVTDENGDDRIWVDNIRKEGFKF